MHPALQEGISFFRKREYSYLWSWPLTRGFGGVSSIYPEMPDGICSSGSISGKRIFL